MSMSFGRTLCAAGWLVLGGAGLAQEQPEPSLTYNEDVKIEKSVPALILSDTNSQPARAFHLRYYNADFEIWDPVRNTAALRVYHGGGNPGIAGQVHLQGPQIYMFGDVSVDGGHSPGTALAVSNAHNPSKNPVLLVEDSNQFSASRNLLRLKNRGASTFRFDNLDTGQNWGFGSLGTGSFFVSSSGVPALSLALTPGGDLTIAGSLIQGSSRDIKDDVQPVRPSEVLERLARSRYAQKKYREAAESNARLATRFPDAAGSKSAPMASDPQWPKRSATSSTNRTTARCGMTCFPKCRRRPMSSRRATAKCRE